MLKAVSSIANAIGAVNYKGTWNASTNSPALASGVGTKGDYYVVSTAGTTTLDGLSLWGVGDWAVFNGSVWQRVEGGSDGEFVKVTISASGPNGLNIGPDTGNTADSSRCFFTNGTTSFAVNNANDVLTFYTSATPGGSTGTARLRLHSGGQFGVATSSTAGTFNLDGSMYLFSQASGTGSNLVYNLGTGEVTYSTSSIRYKENVRPSTYGLADVLKLESVLYERKDTKETELGLIAEQVESVIPEVVGKNKDGETEYINYEKLVSVLAKAIQELKTEFDAYKSSHP